MPRKRDVSDSSVVAPETDIDFSRLEEFNPSRDQVEVEIELALVQIPSFVRFGADATIISFDQSLANTGYVVLKPDEMDGVQIKAMGLFQTHASPDMMQWESDFHRSIQLFTFVTELIGEHLPTLILHETPPVGHAARMFRTESSIVTATVIRNVAALTSIPTQMVSANRVKAYLTGNRNAKKKEVADALKKRFEIQLKTPGFRLNEHTFDALGVAITYLEEQK
jgi:Holliday junction resolvasome RuvABC endonuclease subunit